MMTFLAIDSTKDGRIARGKNYYGALVYKSSDVDRLAFSHGLRVAVFDDKHEWMTFDPKIFKPQAGI